MYSDNYYRYNNSINIYGKFIRKTYLWLLLESFFFTCEYIKKAYEKQLITVDDLCELFLINSLSEKGLTIDDLRIIEATLRNDKSLNDGYFYTRYYGEYNGFYAITLENTSLLTMCVQEDFENLRFNIHTQEHI